MALSVAVLVYFLNHIPASIRINTVLKDIGARLLTDIEARFPDPNTGQRAGTAPDGSPITARETGYVQAISFSRLERIAQRENGKLKLAVYSALRPCEMNFKDARDMVWLDLIDFIENAEQDIVHH